MSLSRTQVGDLYHQYISQTPSLPDFAACRQAHTQWLSERTAVCIRSHLYVVLCSGSSEVHMVFQNSVTYSVYGTGIDPIFGYQMFFIPDIIPYLLPAIV